MTSRTYKDYSAAYFKILDHFSKENPKSLILRNDEIKSLHSRRRDLTRFFSKIASTENDSYAAELYKVSRELTLSIDEKEGTLTIKFNEINKMLEEALPSSEDKSENKEEEKSVKNEEDKKIKTTIGKEQERSEIEDLIRQKEKL